MSLVSKEEAIEAALSGVDYLVKNQVTDKGNANCGRYLCQYDYINNEVLEYTTNWPTGLCVECMMIANKLTSDQIYLDSGQRAVEYLASLQYVSPFNEKMRGVMREETPQTMWAHPRDALTAAWAMLDWSQYTGQKEYLERSVLFADWFLDVAMEKGYPYWTVRMDDAPWDPLFFGSFQSGGAFYFFRLFNITGDSKYKDACCRILDHYNKYHLAPDGNIQVPMDMKTLKAVKGDTKYIIEGWEIMHGYNDDFGALANLAGWKLTGDVKYFNAAECFLKRMVSIQRDDGGFGPAEFSVPSAGGSVLLELQAAEAIGYSLATAEQKSNAARYILNLQIPNNGIAQGGFCGVSNQTYKVVQCTNSRTTTYSIMGLMRYTGVTDSFYFFDSEEEKKGS